MKSIFCLFLIIGIINPGCKKEECNCSEEWVRDIRYYPGDMALHDGICWKAYEQGRGVRPGGDNDDIWEECK
jgi:hypothetical protein